MTTTMTATRSGRTRLRPYALLLAPLVLLAGVIALLGREEGTSVAEVMSATGWLPHTTRAALSGLRKRGYALTREAGENGPRYRIESGPAATA